MSASDKTGLGLWPQIFAVLGITAAAMAADSAGLFPSLPRTLGKCKMEALTHSSPLKLRSAEAIDSTGNQEYFDKYAALVTACMESNGYRIDSSAKSRYTLNAVKTMDHNTGVMPEANYSAVQIESFWQRRWFWQDQER